MLATRKRRGRYRLIDALHCVHRVNTSVGLVCRESVEACFSDSVTDVEKIGDAAEDGHVFSGSGLVPGPF